VKPSTRYAMLAGLVTLDVWVAILVVAVVDMMGAERLETSGALWIGAASMAIGAVLIFIVDRRLEAKHGRA
jgi:hypothetical protein